VDRLTEMGEFGRIRTLIKGEKAGEKVHREIFMNLFEILSQGGVETSYRMSRLLFRLKQK
jgi:hypothetical protein